MSPSAATAGLIRPLVEERALLWGVLASIALHALALLALSWAGAPAPPAKALLVLRARLAPFAAAPVPPAPSRTEAPATALAPDPALTKPRAAPKPTSKPTPKTTSQPTPQPIPQRAAPAEPITAPPAESAPAAPGSVASSPPPPAPVQAKPALQAPGGIAAAGRAAKSGHEADAGTLEQYRLALIVATRRYKRYPAIALERGWQGRVEVRMVIGADGMVASTSIKGGSGHEILDNQALDMLKKGKAIVPIPAGLRGQEFSIDVPVIFNLDNPNS
jgi:protein TonB